MPTIGPLSSGQLTLNHHSGSNNKHTAGMLIVHNLIWAYVMAVATQGKENFL